MKSRRIDKMKREAEENACAGSLRPLCVLALRLRPLAVPPSYQYNCSCWSVNARGATHVHIGGGACPEQRLDGNSRQAGLSGEGLAVVQNLPKPSRVGTLLRPSRS